MIRRNLSGRGLTEVPGPGPLVVWLRGRTWVMMTGVMGSLQTEPAQSRPDLLAVPVVKALSMWPDEAPIDVDQVLVAPIDPGLADTAAFCEAYGVTLAESANCVIVAGRRGEVTKYAACVVLATTRADVNGVVRRHLDVRKCSFAPMEEAVSLTGMEFGGITPIGLPADWPILVDSRVIAAPHVIVGSGVRHSKIAVAGPALGALPGAHVIEGLARELG
ncbi:Cys-tRNA(Pro) deacylase, prolyl-tRNA editing enzyme YbaK/EbsC [Actinoplanes cyaneus]|nr:Cys-tRNA(Pro) deacylase, prolyl-tRNA editing enzyme YbaK/EbsC [Actinoplanes cyaneus]